MSAGGFLFCALLPVAYCFLYAWFAPLFQLKVRIDGIEPTGDASANADSFSASMYLSLGDD
jgi:hypothetical protein